MKSDLLRGHLDRLLLAVLVEKPGHGYALSQRLEERSGGTFCVPEGSLYPALQRLERAALVVSTWHVVEGRRRREYRLTSAGRNAVSESAKEWQLFSGSVDRVMGGLA
ncbi:MAG: helix-turn-helix transcriptional regulator [Actinomycetota bacterium]|nr:helix-turn-helix transcriptional regulator [Actinomycetota bacterium]